MAGFTNRQTKTGIKIRVTVRLPNGKRSSDTFDTEEEAQAWAEKMEGKKSIGLLAPSRTKTVGELLETYRDQVASKTDSGRWNDLRLNKWIDSPIGKERVASITPARMNEWISKRLLDKVRSSSTDCISGSTVNRELNLWSAAFTYSIEGLKWSTSNPVHHVNRPPEGEPRNRSLLTDYEIESICVAGSYTREAALVSTPQRVTASFLLALETGMRSGEILRLRPKDIDWEHSTLKVSASEKGGRKGSMSGRVTSSRTVPLTGRAVEILRQLLETMPANQRPRVGFESVPFIVGVNDQNRDINFRNIRDRAGILDLTFHDTKHEACTRLSKIIDVMALSHAIGTKDLRILRDTYYLVEAKKIAAMLPQTLTTTMVKPPAEVEASSTTQTIAGGWPRLFDV